MSTVRSLADLLEESADRFPNRIAVRVPDGRSITYAELANLSDKVRDRLRDLGVRRGDRVGLRLHKSIDGVATIFGILKAGAAYVPVDADSPAARGAYILNDCQARVLVTETQLQEEMDGEFRKLCESPIVVTLDADSFAQSSCDQSISVQRSGPTFDSSAAQSGDDDVAYILYTSGSTGQPKGVVLSHRNALSFVEWCSRTFAPNENDRFSSHAPFHFDLSILDIYVSIKHGATLVLIDEVLGKEPLRLSRMISSEGVTIWYSTPSILSLLASYGKLNHHDYSALRSVLFAGEVFPVSQYRALRAFWTRQRFFNLYGPTETNVCTWFEIPDDAQVAQMATFPIGLICSPNVGMVIDERDKRVERGTPGELIVSGPNVMSGYWNLPENNTRAFLVDDDGRKWYRTGDIVAEDSEFGFRYLGRRDRMVKRRGYRVELGEIEVALLRHADIREVAVVAVAHLEAGVWINAFVSCAEGRSLTKIALKTIAARALPSYMIPDTFTVLSKLPRTSTDKVDYQALKLHVA